MNKKYILVPCCLIFAVAFIIAIIFGGTYLYDRLLAQPTQEMLFQGVEYIRDVRSSPRRIVIHVIKIDLQADGIRLLVTPGDPDQELPLKARTTSQFLNNFELQVAINGDGFQPWHDRGFMDYYPHKGDHVDVIGYAASEGTIYSQDTDREPRLYLSITNSARINTPTGKDFNVISGNQLLAKDGVAIEGLGGDPNPRTAVALNRSNQFLILVVVDGRQPGYSEGVTLQELAEIIIFHGGWNAINLDGGGSSTMATEGPLGFADVINSPVNHRIPGRERPVGNHLGIYAKPLE